MMPPGTDNPEKMADELNAMDPDQAEQMLQLLAGMQDLNTALSDLNDTVSSMAEEEPGPAAAPVVSQSRKTDEQKERQRNQLWRQIRNLEAERDSLKGLFAGMKKKKLQREIDELRDQLKKI